MNVLILGSGGRETPLRGKLLKAAPAVNCIFVQEMLGQVLLEKT